MILVDEHEPEEILRLISQSAPTVKSPLNRMHMSDYFFGNCEGKTFQFSRKQAGELVGNIDEAEDQLRDYYNQADENYQIIEGIISPSKLFMKDKAIPVSDHSFESEKVTTRELGARLFCYQVEPTGYIAKGHSFSAINDSILYAWIHRLEQAGIATYYTMSWAATARLLGVLYRNEQKPNEEHMTLKRVIKPRLIIKEADPFKKSLMFLSNAYKLGIGETKADALCDRFANLFDIATSSVEDIAGCEGIGKTIATKLLKSFGRSL